MVRYILYVVSISLILLSMYIIYWGIQKYLWDEITLFVLIIGGAISGGIPFIAGIILFEFLRELDRQRR